MSKGLNRVTLIGNLGHGPEIRATASGETVCNLDLATSERYKNRAGEWQEVTEWHRCVFFGKAAETLGEYAKKGDRLYVEGSIRTRTYTGKDGTEKRATEIMGREFLLLGGRSDGAAQDRGHDSRPQPQPATDDLNHPDFYDDSDIPF